MILLTVIVTIGSVAVRLSQREHGRQTDLSWLVTGLGLLCSALLIYRVLIVLPSPDSVIDQKLGALLGLACSLGIAFGGYQSVLERRSRSATIRHRPNRRPTPRLSDLEPPEPAEAPADAETADATPVQVRESPG